MEDHMPAKTISNQKLQQLGFIKHEITYEGCPDHPSSDGWGCPTDSKGNCVCKSGMAPYWSIDQEPIGLFTNKQKAISEFITYVFVEANGVCRKIGEGKVERVRANLKAHYNHGLTKSRKTANDRATSDTIARTCRKNKISFVFVKPAESKDEARFMEHIVKSSYAGWLDYDQK